MARIVVVDDELSMREFLEIMLRGAGHDVLSFSNGADAIAEIRKGETDLVLTDLKMSGMSGLEVLQQTKDHDMSIQVVMMTAFATTETAVQAMKKGAADYVIKPFKVDELKVQLERALAVRELQKENLYLRKRLEDREQVGRLVGTSEPMGRVYDLIRRLARTRTTVLVTGESGTGKELVARAIHNESADAEHPFVAVNCGAIPPTLIESELFGHVRGAFTGASNDRKGLFEAAGKGTIFLDEIAELPPAMQVKLLRVLQERRVTRIGSNRERELHSRVIAATNRDLAQMTSEGGFRQDLYYRLNVVQIDLPPLRERPDDIPVLVEHFLTRYLKDTRRDIEGVTRRAMQRLMSHRFSGNIRELENIIQRAIALSEGPMIDLDSLPPQLQGDTLPVGPNTDVLTDAGVDLDAMIDDLERRLLLKALTKSRGVRKKAAKLLGISFRSLRYRLDKHKIDGDQFAD